MKCLLYLIVLLVRALLTPVKKLVSFLLFPFVYPLRNKVWRSTNAYSSTRWEIDKVIQHNKGWKLWVWFFFDDSIYSDYKVDYHPTKHLNPVVEFICKLIKKDGLRSFLRSWYWAGLRNSSNNLSHYLTVKLTGKLKQVKKVCINKDWIKYELREFEKDVRPYLELRSLNHKINVGLVKQWEV